MFILFWLDKFFKETLNRPTSLDRELEKRKEKRLTEKQCAD